MDNPPQQPSAVAPAAPLEPRPIDPARLERFLQDLKSEQNLAGAIFGGMLAAVVGGILWAAITVATDYQIGYMAVGVGLLVGYAVRLLGKGLDKVYGFVGAGFALAGCLLGNFLTIAVLVAREEVVSILDVLLYYATTPTVTVEAMIATFSGIDLLFYGIAVYEGYKFAFRRVSQAQLDNLRTMA